MGFETTAPLLHLASLKAMDPDANPRLQGEGEDAYPLAAMACCGYSFFCIFAPSIGCCSHEPGKKVVALEKDGEKVYIRPLRQEDRDTRDASEIITYVPNDPANRY